MTHSQQRPASIHVTTVVLIVITGGFATTLIVVTGDLTTLWPLYVIPIVIAALSYHVSGAILVSAFSAALIALMLYGLERDVSALPELIVGMGAFTVAGLVIGAQAHRSHRHQQALEEASVHDPLTGLLKREHLDHRLAEEIRRAERYTLTVAFLVVHIECFDRFLEQFGRYKADVMLEHMGEILQINSRDTDIVGRYAGTSFGVILPYADREQAAIAARHLEEAVTATEFEGDVLEPATHCTVMIGVALYPEDGCSADKMQTIAEEDLGRERR